MSVETQDLTLNTQYSDRLGITIIATAYQSDLPRKLTREELQQYRGLLRRVDERVPAFVWARGNLAILEGRLLAFFCSVNCPESLCRESLAVLACLKDTPAAIVSGFHSPVEKAALAQEIESGQRMVLCPAREIRTLQPRSPWKDPLEKGKLALLSPFEPETRRVTTETAAARSRFVAALADALFIPFASPGGHTEELARDAITWGKPLLTLSGSPGLVSLGARAVDPDRAPHQLALLRLD